MEAFSWKVNVVKKYMSLEKEIQNHNNKMCQDSATNLPSFTAPSHQGELKEKKS